MTERRPDILPPFLCRAGFLLWGFVLPQTVLLVLNLRGWWLIAGEVEQRQQSTALLLFSAELLMLGINLGLYLHHRRVRRRPGPRIALFLLLVHSAYIWWALRGFSEMVPADVAPWIISSYDFFVWNLTFCMPGAFLALYLVASTPLRLSAGRDALYTLGLLLGVPLAWYLAMSILQPLAQGRIGEVVLTIASLVLVMLLLGALVRLLGLIGVYVRGNRALTHRLAVVAFGLSAPLAGLYLNREIPFPADFQSTEVYLLAVLNGLLLWPRSGGPHPAPLLFARAAAYPFILYFFLVFLPFLPLSLIAIIVMGTGFLMLTPVALGVFQTGVLIEDFRATRARIGKGGALLITLAGLALLPGYFTVDALRDRAALHQLLDYVYGGDARTQPSPAGAERAAEALLKLRAQKRGLQLPYLSAFYNRLVFGNMVLTDAKIERMYRLLAGTPLPPVKPDRLRLSNRTWAWNEAGRSVPPNRKSVQLVSATPTLAGPGRTSVRLLLRNDADTTHAEYRASIKIPEGVFVTGLRLKIGDQWVPGAVHDRKAALWVYRKITEVRRDPALLTYRTPDTLELRVYPFPAKGTREVEIDFAFPIGAAAHLELEGQSLDLNPDAPAGPGLFNAGEVVALLGESTLPSIRRRPYLHFILDYSPGVPEPAQYYTTRIIEIAKTLGISRLRLTAANLHHLNLDRGELLNANDESDIRKRLEAPGLPRIGGFWAERALRSELLTYAETVSRGEFSELPVFVLMTPHEMGRQERTALPFPSFAFVTPELDSWYLDQGGELARYDFDGRRAGEVEPPLPAPVQVLKRGDTLAVFSSRRPTLAKLPGSGPLEYFDSRQQAFEALQEANLAETRKAWRSRAELWSRWRQADLDPARLELLRPELFEASRATSTLLPTTAYLVLENSAQERILERKEAQSLANRSALEFEEERLTPEPPGWILLLVLMGLTWALGRYRGRPAPTRSVNPIRSRRSPVPRL